MKIRIFTFALLACELASGMFAPTKPEEATAWYQKMENGVKKWMNEENTEVKIENLSDFVVKFGLQIPTHPDPRWHQVHKHAQAALLVIPGHAKYFQDKIETLRAEVLTTEKTPVAELEEMQNAGQRIPHVSEYEDYCSMTAFPTLAQLPSAETVAVLGFYLNDPVGLDGKNLTGNPMQDKDSDDPSPRPCNAMMAVRAVDNLGIEHPPYIFGPKEAMTDQAIDAWKNWWSEIKAGKRTYRFTGSNIEYGPDGPASPEQIEKARATRERDEKRATGHARRTDKEADDGKESETKERSGSLPLLITATLAVLVSLLWYVRRKKSAA